MGISIWQILVVLLIILILFGAGKLPRVMGDLARGIKSFKSGLKDEDAGREDDTDTASPRVIDAKSDAQSASAAETAERDKVAKG